MATRFYLGGTTQSQTPAYSVSWEVTSAATRRKLVTSKQNTAMSTVVGTSSAGSVDDEDILIRQFISDPMTVQEISGTVKGRILADEANASSNFCPAVTIYVVSLDTSTVRGTLYSEFSDTVQEFSSAGLTNRPFPASGSVSLSPLVAFHGDRLIIEIGARQNAAVASRTFRMRFGDNGSSDLPEDTTTTTQTLNPWIEFSHNFNFNVQNIMMFRLTC